MRETWCLTQTKIGAVRMVCFGSKTCMRFIKCTRVVLGVSLAILLSTAAWAAFEVVTVEPSNGQTGVVSGANISVNFNGMVDKRSIDSKTILVNGRPLSDIPDSAVVFPEEASCVILFRLTPGTAYEIALPMSVKNTSGVSLEKPYKWKFSTKSGIDTSTAPLQVFARYPQFNDMDTPTNAPIAMVFTNELDPASVVDSSVEVIPFQGKPVVGKVTVDGRRLVFRPDEPMSPRKTHEVHLRAGIKGKAGEECKPVRNWQFTTASEAAEGPIATDCWYESMTGNDGTTFIVHASMENLVKPDEDTKDSAEKSKKKLQNPGALLAGHTFKAAIATLVGVFPQQPLSTPTDASAADMPVKNKSVPDTIVYAEYTHGGGAGQGNSVEGASRKSPADELMDSVVEAALKSSSAIVMRDSGDEIKDGDNKKGDLIYSGRLFIDNKYPEGQALLCFAIEKPDGTLTDPVTMGHYVFYNEPAPASAQ